MNLKKFDKPLFYGNTLTDYKSLLDISAVDIDGKQIKRLGDILKGKKLILVVNVASKCGLTKTNYVFMKKMYDRYKT
jgi:glutathione peroxidase